jgi:hypothetical protein
MNKRIRAACAAILSIFNLLHDGPSQRAVPLTVSVSKRDDDDASMVQEGPEHEPQIAPQPSGFVPHFMRRKARRYDWATQVVLWQYANRRNKARRDRLTFLAALHLGIAKAESGDRG